jgi:hypothetical protein
MDYKTEWEQTFENVASDFKVKILDKYSEDAIMGHMFCPKCGQKFYQVEEGGPEWNVCHTDMKPFKKVSRLMCYKNKNGDHLIIDITLCDCGEPIHGFAIDEGWFQENGDKFSNQDFLPSRQVWEDECDIKNKPELKIIK